MPAHLGRSVNSLFSQLGFILPSLNYDALELSKFTTPEDFIKKRPELTGEFFLQNSDTHYIEDKAKAYNRL